MDEKGMMMNQGFLSRQAGKSGSRHIVKFLTFVLLKL